MKKCIAIVVTLAVSACSSNPIVYGHKPDSFSPKLVVAKNQTEEPKAYSIIVGAEGEMQSGWMKAGRPKVRMRLLDEKNSFSKFLSGYQSSIKVASGKVGINISYSDIDGTANRNITGLKVDPGKTYLVNFKKNDRRVTFWVEDVDTQEVIYGKRTE